MKDLDIVVWGATGFTGRLVAEYLAQRHPPGEAIKWAIAGRSEAKLKALRSELGAGFSSLPTLTADSHDRASLDALCARTRVVCATVGPYAKHGGDLVAACAAAGVHYCDLAGEAQFMRAMIDAHEEAARASGARIVHACGFDSIPSDMGVYFLQQQAQAKTGQVCDEVRLYVKATKGGASGGTAASFVNAVKDSRGDRDKARALGDPYSLYPRNEKRGKDGGDLQRVAYDDHIEAWTGPFVMAAINTKVVRRGNAVAGFPYGRDFRYSEQTLLGKGVGAWAKGAMLTATLGGLVAGAAFGPTRSLLQRFVLPDPGEGPNEQQRESGFFNLLLLGLNAGTEVVRVKVTGDRDPGYGSTSKMLGEAAVCLAADDLAVDGGFWTPASAMGDTLLSRLQENAGLTFTVID